MDIEMIIQKYLLFTSISEYRGSAKSLLEMIYWTTGQIVPIQNIERVVSTRKCIGKHYLIAYKNAGRIEIHITKIAPLSYKKSMAIPHE